MIEAAIQATVILLVMGVAVSALAWWVFLCTKIENTALFLTAVLFPLAAFLWISLFLEFAGKA